MITTTCERKREPLAVRNAKQREYRRRTAGVAGWRYEKTIAGFLMRAYRNMQSRTAGLIKPHLYKGLSLLPRADFYRWSRGDREFNYLYRAWVRSGYDRKLSPSVNRINAARGYDLDNIEWVTHSVNSALGARNRASARERKCIERILRNVRANAVVDYTRCPHTVSRPAGVGAHDESGARLQA